jgi:hypothetical protein
MVEILGKIRTAKIKVSTELLFNLLGINNFDGYISRVVPVDFNFIDIHICGDDGRLPEREDYPECNVICRTIESHFEIIE